LDWVDILHGVYWHVVLPWVKLSGQSEFGRHRNTGQQRLYEFCYLFPFDLWTFYLARILFLKTWYDLGKVTFRFWCKMCNYPVLQKQSYFSIRPLDQAKILRGVSWHVVLPRFKISSQLEFWKVSKHGSTEVVRLLLFTSFWLVDFLFG
jgi:hypothetical protein